MSSLGEEYPKQQARCRELLKQYQEIGTAGVFGAAMIEGVLREADEAAVQQDLPRMIIMFERMKGCE